MTCLLLRHLVFPTIACVAWRFWLGALSNKGGRGQRNLRPARQNRHATQAIPTKPASTKRGVLVTKRKRPREGERREAKQGLALFLLLAFLCAQRERELLSVPAGNHERVELDVLGIIVEDMYQRVLSLQNAYFFFYFM